MAEQEPTKKDRKTRRTLEERFWAKVNKTSNSGPWGDCWIWIAAKSSRGYGVLQINGKSERANRVSYRIAISEIPMGLCVLHRCDNPSCVNPAHLFLGTYADNSADARSKGRTLQGQRAWNARLTNEMAETVVNEYASGKVSLRRLAKRFGVNRRTISRLINGETYNGIGVSRRGESAKRRSAGRIGVRLTEDVVVQILTEYAAGGVGYLRLARRYGASKSTIRNIVQGKTWRRVLCGIR